MEELRCLGSVEEGPYGGGNIIVLKAPTFQITNGMHVIGVADNKRLGAAGSVLEIQVDSHSIDSYLPDASNTSIGLKVNFEAKRNWKFYVFSECDPYL